MLYPEYAAGLFKALKSFLTEEGLESLIKLHMPLAAGMAKKYAKRQEREPDDYVGVAYLAVVEAVHNAFKYMVHDNITPYVAMYVKRALVTFYRENRVVAIPLTTQRTFFRLGYLVQIRVRPLEPEDVLINTNNDLLSSLIEILPNLLHRQVLQLRLERHTDKEIASLLNLDVLMIRTIRNHLKKTLTALLEDD